MGVHGLWELLAPVGRRVSVETLAGRRLAIDASIWMVQFMKAMRDDKGEMVRNAHILGFFRRICKLLYLRTKPVFVFDGGTPALKRRTVIARRRQRENAQSKLRKTAEKLLLNHLKAMKLKDLAEDIKHQRQNQKNDTKGKEVSDQAGILGNNTLEKNDLALKRCNQEKLDEMLAASIVAEEEGGLTNNSPSTSAAVPCEEDDKEEDEELILPEMHGEVDPAVLAALPPSMQLGLLLQKNKQENDAKGKKIMSDPTEVVGINSEKYDAVLRSVDQEKLDEMIAASIAAETDACVTNNASTSTASILVEEDVNKDEDDEDEEVILPAMHGEVDPAVLAALPPSMQLDLLVQMRERLMAENRQKYQKVKKDPGKFSELQIQSYLKTVAFRREIDHVQKAASGRGFSGVQTSRIASESHREFIFSSSFTGDKQVLTAARADRSGDKEQAPKEHTSNFKNSLPSTDTVAGSCPGESPRDFDDNIETYLDERGHVRVSRVRAMGIRMTRDLQRNLDLMKEMEWEKTNANKITDSGNWLTRNNIGILRRSPSNETLKETSRGDNGDSDNIGVSKSHPGQNKVGESSFGDNDLNERNNLFMSKLGTPIEISIEDDGDGKPFDAEDDLFARLAAGNPVTFSSANETLRKQFSGSDSDCDWEEGALEGKHSSFHVDSEIKIKSPDMEANNSDDSEVEWEEGFSGITENTSSYPSEFRKTTSKGYNEEDADLQEAIKRSLEDIGDVKCSLASLDDEKLKTIGEEVHKASGYIDRKTKMVDPVLLGKISTQRNGSVVDGVAKPNSVEYLGSFSEQVMQDASESANFHGKMQSAVSVTPSGTKEAHVITEQTLVTLNEGGGLSTIPNACEKINALNSDALSGDATDWVNDQKIDIETQSSCHLVGMATSSSLVDSLPNKLTDEFDADGKWVKEKIHDNCFQDSDHNWDKSPVKGIDDADIKFTEANLEEEMLILDQECMNLGDEQRRLERNVESVSSEMFTECQALLQMFGIPYIIAPMEAEAQCAYLELANLVDGVVTDDSDVFLFGARSVYKNIFDDRKYVETYFMKDVESELGLTRDKLIRMALLLGSDYTEGVSGIGIVNAIEVVNAFPEEDGLHKFRNWIESPDPTILGKLDAESGSSARKRGSKFGKNDINTKIHIDEDSAFEKSTCQGQEHVQSDDLTEGVKQIFMDKHRKVSKNWHIPLSFPSEAVTSAYTCPQVDKSTEPFTWGKPDHFVLRKLCWEKFGWGSQKSDELLVPVLKEYSKHETQLRLEAFYTFNERFAKIRSKRINKAVKGITGNQPSELMNDAAQEGSNSRKKRSRSTDQAGVDNSDKLSVGTEKSILRNESNSKRKSTRKQSRKRQTAGEPAEGGQTNRKSDANRRGRGRGTSRVLGRGKRKKDSSSAESQNSSNAGEEDDNELVVHMATFEGSGEVRRSGRLQRPVNYRDNDLDIDDLDHTDIRISEVEAGKQVLFKADHICDEVSGLSKKKQKNVGELSLKEGQCKDYLEVGGGFCPSEDETSELGLSNVDQYFQADVSDDNIKMAGRFSRAENESGANRDGVDDQATGTTVSGNGDLSDFSGFIDEADLGHISVQSNLPTKRPLVGLPGSERTSAYDSEQSLNHHIFTSIVPSTSNVSLQENTVNSSGKPSVGALSAMPFLRKKRRKS